MIDLAVAMQTDKIKFHIEKLFILHRSPSLFYVWIEVQIGI